VSVTDLADWRQLRDLKMGIAELRARIDAAELRRDPELARTVLLARAAEIEMRHAWFLARVRPVLRELNVLYAACLAREATGDAAHDTVVDAAVAANAAAMALGEGDMVGEMPARVAAVRADIATICARLRKENGGRLPGEAPDEPK
jgi:hypothetical protein